MKQNELLLQVRDIYAAVEYEISIHPHIEVVDIYKLVLQAYFGPSHIVQNRAQVSESIFAEVLAMQNAYLPLFQDIGNKQGFWRLSLDLLVPAKEQGHEYLHQQCDLWADAMLESCLETESALGISDRWKIVQPMLEELIEASPQAWQQVAEMAAKEQVPSHSQKFSEAYTPHYRLMYPVGDSFVKLLR